MTITADQITELDEAITGAAGAPANVCHPLGRAPLPYWQDHPCPSWCMMSVPHRDYDMADDRYHVSAIYQMDLALEDLIASDPFFLTTGLHQHYRECDPHVIITVNGAVDIHFTISEASELARRLTLLSGGESTGNDVCPPWCTAGPHADPSIGDRNHLGDYGNLVLSLHDADVSYSPAAEGQKPEPVVEPHLIGVRLEQGWREREARVGIVYRDEYTDLTLAEARELADALSSLLCMAAKAA